MTIHLTVCGQSDVGLVRQTNEDSLVIADLVGGPLPAGVPETRFDVGARGVLLAVSDGLGGHRAGEVASGLVLESLQRAMLAQGSALPVDVLMERAVEKANRDVWLAAQLPGREKMGATLTALFIHRNDVYIAEVGDSRAYLLRGGVLTQLTRDQSYTQLMVDSGTLTPEQAQRSQLRNLILQAMGQRPDVSVALGRLALRQLDCLLICSDGLTNKVSADEIRDVILSAMSLDAACTQLVELAKSHGGEDNITVILAGVSGELPPLVAAEPIASTFAILKDFIPASLPAAP